MAITNHDLGNGWYVTWSRGEQDPDVHMAIRNPEKGQRINLSAESVERLRNIFIAADREVAA